MDNDIKAYIIDFLKSFTRVIVESNLYDKEHPQVKDSANDAVFKFKRLVEKLSLEKISFALWEGKFLMNGLQITTQDRLPNSILNIYKLYIDSIEINKDVSNSDFILFSKIAASKQNPDEFIKSNNIKGIKVTRDKYIKSKETGKLSEVFEINGDIKEKDFESSLKLIVSRLTDNHEVQQKIVSALLDKFRTEVENLIERAVKEVKKEKIKVENDYTRTQSVISNIAASEITIDKDGNIIMVSPDAEKITGKELKEISGKKIFDIDLEEQIINIANEIKTVSDEKFNSSVSVKGKSDMIDAIRKSTAMIKNQDGKIVGTISVPPNLVKLKEVEQLKSDFISSVTHEMRSPLASIKMALDLMSRENIANQNARVMLNTAIRNAERLNSVINDILDFSKLQSGKMIFNMDKHSPNDIAQSAADSMTPWAKSKNLNLSVVKNPLAPCVYVDRKRTEQILINLISNAIKFTPESGNITVSIDYDNSNPNYVKFLVKDTGCGIKKDDQEKIFERFVQVAQGVEFGGTGLGLAITKAMVIMQGGSISVESDVGKGSTFYVFLPVHKGQTLKAEILNFEENKKDFSPKPWWKRLFRI